MNEQSFLVALIATPVILYFALRVQRIAGPSVAGLVAALPFQLAIGAFVAGISIGNESAAEFGLAAASFLSAQIAYGIAFAYGMKRGGTAPALIAGLSAYSLVVLVVRDLELVVAASLGLVAMVFGMQILKTEPRVASDELQTGPRPLTTIVMGTAVVLAVLVCVDLGGPRAGGFLATVPLFSTTLAIASLKHHGKETGSKMMAGMIRGLPSYFVFALVIAISAKSQGIVAATLIGIPISGLTAFTNYKLGMSNKR